MFAEQLTALFVDAGNPVLGAIATEATARGAKKVDPKRLSAWRNGVNLPEWQDQLRLVLVSLFDRATKQNPAFKSSERYRYEFWQRLLAAAAEQDARRGGERRVIVEQPCPYKGLEPFRSEDSESFFGRTRLTEKVVNQIRDASRSGGITMMVASSGAGKSSLIQAGVIPALTGDAIPGSSGWQVVVITPGEDPLVTLARAIPDLVTPFLATSPEPGPLAQQVRAGVRAWLSRNAEAASRLLLVVDQAEEMFTLCQDDEHRERFITALQAMSASDKPAADGATAEGEGGEHEPPAVVLVAIRADFTEHCLGLDPLAAAYEHRLVVVTPMSIDELRSAIVMPARRLGVSVDRDLVEHLLDEIGRSGRGRSRVGRGIRSDPGLLPLLSHAMRETWEQRKSNKLTLEVYRRSGGIQQAIAQAADRTWSRLVPDEQRAAMWLLLHMVWFGIDSPDTRRRCDKRQLIEQAPSRATAEKALDVLADGRLIMVDAESVQITHEALLTAWPRLSERIEADRSGHLLRQRLEDAASDWARSERTRDKLYRGSPLTDAREWSTDPEHRDQLSETAKAFLAASEQQERKAVVTRRRVLVGLGSLTALALTGMTGAVVAAGQASRERDIAVLGQITAEADRLRTIDSSLAALLDLVAYRRDDTPDARANLINSGPVALSAPIFELGSAINSVVWSPDGRTLASGSGDGSLQMWERTPTGLIARGRGTRHNADIITIAYSPDGRTVASVSVDQTARLWDVTDPGQPRTLGDPLTGYGDNVISVAFRPDGQNLATVGADLHIHLWDVSDRARPHLLSVVPAHSADINSVAYSPDGRTLATGSDDSSVCLWDVTDPRRVTQVAQLMGHRGGVTPLAYSPDGRTVASGGEDQTVRLWDVSNPRHAGPLGAPLIGHRGRVFMVKYSPDGRRLASSSVDRTVRLWNLTDPADVRPIGEPFYGHTNIVYSVGWSPSGRTLASGAEDRSIRIWDIPDTLIGHTDAVSCLDVSPKRQLLATAGDDSAIRLWDVRDPTRSVPIGQITVQSDHIASIALHPTGRVLASVGSDQTISLWNVADLSRPTLMATLRGHKGKINSIAYSSDGRTLASGSEDQTIRLWDVTDPARPGTVVVLNENQDAGRVATVRFSPDGRTLATGSDEQTVLLWNVTNPMRPVLRATLVGHARTVTALAFSPDEHTLASASSDQTILLWNIANLERVPRLAELRGHSNNISAVDFSPDGQTLASASTDQTVRLWDVTNPRQPGPIGQGLTGHTDGVTALAFNPADATLISGSEDRTVRVWDIRTDPAIRRICSSTQGSLTEPIWNQYLPGVPYEPPCGAS